MLCDRRQEVIHLPIILFEIGTWRFDIGVYISCNVFVLFSSGHSEIAVRLSTRVQPNHSLSPVSQQ